MSRVEHIGAATPHLEEERLYKLAFSDSLHDARLIPLTRGAFAIVDAADFEWLMEWNWRVFVPPNGIDQMYAVRATNPGGVRMHRQIIGAADGVPVDHKNGLGLDNRRCNLRLATATQNAANTRKPVRKAGGSFSSRFKGVCWHAKDKRWRANIQYERHKYFLGQFANEVDAARAYDAAAKRCFGPFARLNFPHDDLCQEAPDYLADAAPTASSRLPAYDENKVLRALHHEHRGGETGCTTAPETGA